MSKHVLLHLGYLPDLCCVLPCLELIVNFAVLIVAKFGVQSCIPSFKFVVSFVVKLVQRVKIVVSCIALGLLLSLLSSLLSNCGVQMCAPLFKLVVKLVVKLGVQTCAP